ncbi:uncharacterized protein LOC117245399 [Parus major]|uniref:uncharacterized protein LOC117245399 n=1 Tax=Parus major TaxID=9157 RepID=UPI0014442CA7|nr:uncharacterized protein LOC117245399 [Parus major]
MATTISRMAAGSTRNSTHCAGGAGRGEARVGAVPGAVEREAAQGGGGARRRPPVPQPPLQQHAAVPQHVGHQRTARGAVGAAPPRRALEAAGRRAEAEPRRLRAIAAHLVGAPRLVGVAVGVGVGVSDPKAQQGEQRRQQAGRAGHAGGRRMETRSAGPADARGERGLRSRRGAANGEAVPPLTLAGLRSTRPLRPLVAARTRLPGLRAAHGAHDQPSIHPSIHPSLDLESAVDLQYRWRQQCSIPALHRN